MKLCQLAFVLAIASLSLGCAMNSQRPRGNEEIRRYSGEFWDYEVEAQEIWVNGLCSQRTVILKLKVGLHIRPTVSYVRAVDDGCRDIWSNYYFRDPIDRERADQDLSETLLAAFYAVKGTK